MTLSPKRNRQRAVVKRVRRMLGDRALCPRCQATHADLGGGVRPECPWDRPRCDGERAVREAALWAREARARTIDDMRRVAALECAAAAGAIVALMILPIWRVLP